MTPPLSLRDLTLPGEPLDGAVLLTADDGLRNAVSWVVSLRPYSPAFPRMRGGELALVATDNLARLSPPITLRDVVQLLRSTGAAAMAVRGEIVDAAVQAAQDVRLPLLSLPADAPLADIEQAVMRECALHQVRSEIIPPQEPDTWFTDLLSGHNTLREGAISRAQRQGYSLSAEYAIAFITKSHTRSEQAAYPNGEAWLVEKLSKGIEGQPERFAAVWIEGGFAILLAPDLMNGVEAAFSSTSGETACGISTARPLTQVATTLAEAQLAAKASARVHNGAITRYAELGALGLLLILERDHPEDMGNFTQQTIGPLLEHDTRSGVPLLPTVRTFIEHGGRLRETAAALFVHRNTLAYRLDRAAEILGADLKEPEARLAIELALRALLLRS